MDIIPNNYCEYGRYSWLLQNQSEPLFLKPDGVRTRYPIGWNGYGRYIPDSLRVKYNGIDCNITEEDNGIWYNFEVAPGANTSYNDYEISYITRPLDYAFSTGNILGGYEGEEYFLFPNWNNALELGDAFWIGKWQASNDGNNMPQSKSNTEFWCNITCDNARIASKSKGTGFNIVHNRQWVSIALWTDHMGIDVKGNIYGRNTSDLDNEGTPLVSCGGGYNALSNTYVVTGNTVPDSWNHNGKSNGIKNMVGNIYEFVVGLQNRNGDIYLQNENGYYNSGINTASYQGNDLIVDITNTTNDLLNEGIANIISTNGYVPSNLNNDKAWYINDNAITFLARGGSSENGENSGIWSFSLDTPQFDTYGLTGFRLSRKLI